LVWVFWSYFEDITMSSFVSALYICHKVVLWLSW